MRPTFFLPVAAIGSALLSLGATAPAPRAEPFALVELFTSEGCSSCPPADALLSDLARDAARSGRAVYALEWHVEVWDHLGWKDPFGSPAATRRQRDYARHFGLDGVYTPQMVVNGRSEFVGSDRGRATRDIDAALARPASATLRVSAKASADGVEVSYAVTGAPETATVAVALVEDGNVSRVRAGENGGRTLAHSAVVQAFASQALGASDHGSLALPTVPKSSSNHARRIVAFVQERGTGAILAATSAAFP